MFEKDDFVRTSKGKVGRIVVPESISIGYYVGGSFVEVYNASDVEMANTNLSNLQLVYSSRGTLELKKNVNMVLLGNRQFPIAGENLEKLETVSVIVQQGLSSHAFNLPQEDAKLFIDILKRNKIWYALR